MDRTKYFPGKVFELLATFRIQITNTCSKYLEKIKFWPATPLDSASPNVLYLFALLKFTSCFHKWKRYTNHSGHKTRLFGELQHRKFVFWQPIMATKNLSNYKSQNLFSDYYTEDLSSHHYSDRAERREDNRIDNKPSR